MTKKVGIIGVGKLGTAIGRLVANAGHELFLLSRPEDSIRELTISVMLPDSSTLPLEEMKQIADIIILAVPQSALADLDLDKTRGIIVDATNAWETTYTSPALDNSADSSEPMESKANPQGFSPIATTYPNLRVVKTLNHAAYTELTAEARQAGEPGRRALGVVSDDPAAQKIVGEFIDSIGFDPYLLPSARAQIIEPNRPAFGARLELADWKKLTK